MNDCLFCNIANSKIPAQIVYEDEYALGVLDIHPRAAGHTMVIPKRHAETILDVPDEDLGALFQAVKRVAALLKKTLEPEGFTIGINHGKVSGQAVDHLHVHIIPRWRNDGGTSLHGIVNPPEGGFSESLDDMRKKIVQQ